PSGSGKSTLLHVMGTLERPSAGHVAVAGAAVDDLDDRELAGLRATAIGFVFQSFFLIDGMTPLENLPHALLYTATPPHAPTAPAGRPRPPPPRARRRRAGARPPPSPPGPSSSPAASASGWRSPAPSSRGRRSSSPTSRPGTSTPGRAPRSWGCCASSTARER